jgi:hypothetical protein
MHGGYRVLLETGDYCPVFNGAASFGDGHEKAVSALRSATRTKTRSVLRRWCCLPMMNPSRTPPPKRRPIVQGRKAAMECGGRARQGGDTALQSRSRPHSHVGQRSGVAGSVLDCRGVDMSRSCGVDIDLDPGWPSH